MERRSTKYPTSRASASRWYFGRAERQRLYETARTKLRERAGESPAAAKFAFVDDLQEMIAEPRPSVPDPGNPDSTVSLPVSLETKIAVFVADGDKFGETIKSLNGDSDAVKGQSVFTISIDKYLRELVETLVLELAKMRDTRTHTVRAQESLAAALPQDSSHRHKGDREHLSPGDLLLRFETLLLGGDDLTFVVPAWLGWWLAKRFFSVSREWKISAQNGGKEYPIKFSAGMIFAPAKSPIRSLKQLAGSLCGIAKGVGGLEVEVIESLEPPAGGIDGLRDRLLGKLWRDRDGAGTSRLAIRRDDIDATLGELARYWTGAEALPASQLHHALRAAQRCGALASPAAAAAAGNALQRYAENAGASRGFTLESVKCLPNAAGEFAALKLYFLLQQRDYVIAGWPFAKPKESQ